MPPADEPVSLFRRLYGFFITPILFVSFLFSLAWVEFSHSLLRQSHDETTVVTPSTASAAQWPAWLHRLVFRRNEGQQPPQQPPYHTTPRQLLWVETAEAFRIRTTVLWGMGAVVMGGAMVVGQVVVWGWRGWMGG